MSVDWQQAGVNIISGLVAGTISAGLATRWALARFRSEKWWQTKLETYTQIARALVLLKRYVDAWIRSYELRYEQTEDYQRRILDDWHSGSRAVDEATVLGSFIISPAAAAVLQTLRREKGQADPDDPYEEAMAEVGALDRAIPAFVAAAKEDLGVPGKSTSLRRRPEQAG